MNTILSTDSNPVQAPTALVGLRPPRKARILVVDDEKINVQLISRFLIREGYEVVCASNGVEAIASVKEYVLMPVMDGLTACRALRSEFATRSLPIILVTARHTLEDRLQGLRAGIDDFISKPFDLEELKARLEGALQRRRWDQSSQPLTHLPASPAIEEEIWKRLRVGSLFAFAYIDIDNFKAFNDVYGYDAGDKVIKTVASSLVAAVKSSTAEGSFAGHIGGDDFVFVSAIEQMKLTMPKVIADFDGQRTNFYRAEDIKRGGFQTKNRLNQIQNFPLMTLSVAIVSTETRRLLHYARLVEIASELKRYVKLQDHAGTSLCIWDRRSDLKEAH